MSCSQHRKIWEKKHKMRDMEQSQQQNVDQNSRASNRVKLGKDKEKKIFSMLLSPPLCPEYNV